MKKIGLVIFIISVLAVSVSANGQQDSDVNKVQETASQVPFSRGVTFGGWFEFINSAQQIPFKRFVEQDFADVKDMGVDVIRLPIDFNVFTSGAPDYTIDPLLFKLLDKAVDWAEKYQIYIILDFHTSGVDGVPPINNNFLNILLAVWTQMAEQYKNRSNYVIYDILNEPNGISAGGWGKMQGDVIDAIRKIDKNHWIVVGGVEWNSYNTLSSLPKYTDNKLLYTFHFYDPFIFTHQGATWIPKSVIELVAGVPFPYDKSRMPIITNKMKGKDAEFHLKAYPKEGTTQALAKNLDKAANFIKQRNVPVFCGEFGAYMRNSFPEDRIRYYQFVREALDARNIPWITWDYYDNFGIFNWPGGEFTWSFTGDIKTDLNVELVQVLGFTPPVQTQRVKEPLRSGFTVYDDYLGRGSQVYVYSQQNTFNTYYSPPADGEFAIYWGNINRKYDGIRFLLPVSDFTYLAQNGFVLEFKAKTEKPVLYDVKFLNLQDNIEWQNGYRLDQRLLQPDGKWHTVRIPLKDIQLWGGWDIIKEQQVEAQGRTNSWNNITAIEFMSVQEDGSILEIYLDDIKVVR